MDEVLLEPYLCVPCLAVADMSKWGSLDSLCGTESVSERRCCLQYPELREGCSVVVSRCASGSYSFIHSFAQPKSTKRKGRAKLYTSYLVLRPL